MCGRAGLSGLGGPQLIDLGAQVEVLSDEATGITVHINAALPQAAQLQARLQEVLAPLPVKTRVILRS